MDSKELYELAKEYEEREDLEETYRYYLEAALADDDGEAVSKLANMYLNGDYVDIDFDKSAHYFEIALERDYKIPIYLYILIGSTYEKESSGTAVEWYRRAADAGYSYAYACLGEHLYHGDALPQDYKKAYEYFEKSGVHTISLYYLGLMYENGYYVNRNKEKAREYYRRIMDEFPDHKDYGDLHYELAEERLSALEKQGATV